MIKKLEKEINKIDKQLKCGDSIELMYDGKSVAKYDFVERSIDCKTPLQWLRGCLAFDISLKGRDINKVTLKYNKVINHKVGNCRITLI
jgi:hypothetical protein